MAAAHDFHRLYATLGLDAECGVDVFRQRMRRRIARLHPDRGGGAAAVTEVPPLDELLALYAAARRFHRVHGRLPGASPRAAPAAIAPRAAGTPVAREPRTARRSRPPSAPMPPADARARMLVALGIVAVLLAWLAARVPAQDAGVATQRGTTRAVPSMDAPAPVPSIDAQAQAQAGPLGARARPPLAVQYLALGQDVETVLALQGAPLHRGDDTWDYGPSWIRFSRGRVTGWSSSPTYPLRAETRTPPPDMAPGVHAGD